MRKISLILSLVVFMMNAQAQKKKKESDIQAIKAMCGCYEIEFNFAETFAPAEDYEFHDNYQAKALEYVFPVQESKDKIVLQHLLVIGDTMIIKHWRQDWLFENTDLYTFYKDNTWKYKQLNKNDVKGQWTQKVYQVDDGPRYQGSATWVHVDGKNYWEATSDAPLPRREFSKRDDYNVMARKNRQEITEYGWLHEQDNQKIIRKDGDDEVLAWEKGWNTYSKTDDSKCSVAKKWWTEHQNYWSDVRSIWDELFASKRTVKIKQKVDDKVLFMQLFALQDELKDTKYDSNNAKNEIRAVIQKYLESKQKLTMN